MQRLHSKRGTQCMFSPIGLPLFSNQLLTRFTQDQKGLSKACNEDDCKDVSKITRRIEKGPSYAVSLSAGASLAGVVPDGKTMPDPLAADVDVSIGDV
ncbi:hypothetical protein H5410_040643 [Solanum commersonii]|uniref:Uncharacterized protein n=1 Tax=Solanum commersonii TaxID=4109 RepID=A0A9J5XPJ3_SOLCO|nr:hypothetical protein H5410_040643 [Solanum commersonii]